MRGHRRIAWTCLVLIAVGTSGPAAARRFDARGTRTLERLPLIPWIDWEQAMWAGVAGAVVAGTTGLFRRKA